ncbi:hypothetical protein D9757_000776 [Collybiopsis confluens]|uniref:Uncharacterized protein n=1 Tax=Collybiopsis confluens TaxID=2823264 RepID=A0A8H5MGS9_9AGAR|nr:hypothetical protein D9757_000776 [Collybiopsis confluens]
MVVPILSLAFAIRNQALGSCDGNISSIQSIMSSSPTKRRLRPPPLSRRDSIGIDPDQLIGKRLIRISRSSSHPALTLDFDDSTAAQVLVDGYNPHWKGAPKILEMDDALQRLANCGSVGVETLEIVDCAIIKLCDKAFYRKQSHDDRWDQEHQAVCLKFSGENKAWHCVWAALTEYDEHDTCVFRSFDDCYLDFIQRSPRKKSSRRQSVPQGL